MAKTSESQILAELAKKATGAWNGARGNEPKVKGQRLPGGIINGIAKLKSFKLDRDKNRNPYIAITASVIEPEEYAGCRATKMHFLKSTPKKPLKDRIEDLISDIQLLGEGQSEDGESYTEGTTIDDCPRLLKELCEQGVVFKFNTWCPPKDKRNPDPQTMIFIQGVAEDYEADGEVEAEEEEDAEKEDETPEEDETASTEEDPEEEDGEEDKAEENDTEDGEEDWTPAKDEIYNYKASAKGKAQECKVTSVSITKKTVTVVRVSDSKKFANIAWDKLESAA
jgi:hypothetical protein